MEPYEARSFRFIELLTLGDWRMKLYGIAWHRELPRPELLEAARRVAADTLEKETANNYKVGFIGAHDGRNACFVFVDFWGRERTVSSRVPFPWQRAASFRSLENFRFIGVRLGLAPAIFRARRLDKTRPEKPGCSRLRFLLAGTHEWRCLTNQNAFVD
jgi:hypothetical protein